MATQQWWQITRNDEVPLVAPNRQPRFGVSLPSEISAETPIAANAEVDDYRQLQQALLRTRPLFNEIYRADRLSVDAPIADTTLDADTGATNVGAWAYLDGSG